MHTLLGREPNIEETEQSLVAAVGNWAFGTDILQILLDKGDETKITAEMLRAAAANGGCGTDVLEMLLDSDPDIEITQELAAVAETTYTSFCDREAIYMLLDRDPEMQISEEVLRLAEGNPSLNWATLRLLRSRCPCPYVAGGVQSNDCARPS